MIQMPEILTVEEVAALLRIDERTVYRKIEDREIPGHFRLGNSGAHRFLKAKVLDWIQQQTQPKTV